MRCAVELLRHAGLHHSTQPVNFSISDLRSLDYRILTVLQKQAYQHPVSMS